MSNINILKGMQTALENDGLTLSYQTIRDTDTGEVLGAEALLRWEKDNPNQYTMDQILPVIENTNLIHDIGYWTLRKACETCRQWNQEGHAIPVSVNLSVQQLTRPSFAKTLTSILAETKLKPHRLILEITEDALINDKSEVLTQLKAIKVLGVKLSIDGFGSGYSNMTYLADLQVDEIKIDKRFVSSINHNEKTRLVVSTFINLAHKLGIQLVANGVETDKDRKALASLGCPAGQGYLWAAPVPAAELRL